MTTKLYDSAFELSVSPEHFENIRKRYESLRKTELYRGQRIKKIFDTKIAVETLEEHLNQGGLQSKDFSLAFGINFPKAAEENAEVRWREYNNTLIRLFGAFARKQLPLDLTISPNHSGTTLGYEVTTKIDNNHTGESTSEKAEKILRILLLPESTRYAVEPIRISLNGKSEHNGNSSNRFELYKQPCHDFITLNDIPLVFNYYRQIAEVLLSEIGDRGLTTYCAVDWKDGESIIRRNASNGKRLVVADIDEIGRLIMDYDIFRFVPDVNFFGSKHISRIPIDFDRPMVMDWFSFSEIVNGFLSWLKEQGFEPRLRITGGRGAQVILPIEMDRIAKNYHTPFPRPLKFDSWVKRVGEAGLVSAQATDFVKTLALAYGCYRKNRLGLNAPITVEIHDLSQRYWNMLIDSSRAAVDTGVVGLGSIHHKTGAVCMPVTSLPSRFSLESAISRSHFSTNIEIPEFQSVLKSPWIQTVGTHPDLMYEPALSSRDNSFSLVEETFEKYGWIPNKYVQLTSQRFLERYCWRV